MYQSYNRYRRKTKQNSHRVANGTFERCVATIHSDFENLTWCFGLKTSGNYNSKELSLKADGIKFHQQNRKEMSSTNYGN